MLRLERDAWSMVKRLRQATNEYPPPPSSPPIPGSYMHSSLARKGERVGVVGVISPIVFRTFAHVQS